jgi:hypothetical protein
MTGQVVKAGHEKSSSTVSPNSAWAVGTMRRRHRLVIDKAHPVPPTNEPRSVNLMTLDGMAKKKKENQIVENRFFNHSLSLSCLRVGEVSRYLSSRINEFVVSNVKFIHLHTYVSRLNTRLKNCGTLQCVVVFRLVFGLEQHSETQQPSSPVLWMVCGREQSSVANPRAFWRFSFPKLNGSFLCRVDSCHVPQHRARCHDA